MSRYPYKNTFTAAAAATTGHASNVTGAVWAIATPSALDGIAHFVTIHNDAATDHSAKTIVLVGTDANGNPVTETLAAPAGTATVTSAKAYRSLTSATPSATIGADTFDIGWAATGHTPWVDLDPSLLPFGASAAVFLVSGSLNFDVQHCYDNPPTEDSVSFKISALTGKTASTDGSYTAPVNAVRVNINSHTSAVFTFLALQGGH